VEEGKSERGDYLNKQVKNLTGQKFGRLLVIKYIKTINKRSYWLCKCDCGNEKEVIGNYLSSGRTKSCGCYQHESIVKRFTTHGKSNEKLYYIWKGMLRRCENSKHRNYKDYGGRGISVCEEWHNLNKFIDWAHKNGYAEGLEIDRVNNNGIYEPNNCKWSTRKEQTLNTRRNIKIELDGEIKSLSEWCEILGFKENTIQYRYYRGDRGERLFRPINTTYNWRAKCIAKNV
jgi:hypothetical protein